MEGVCGGESYFGRGGLFSLEWERPSPGPSLTREGSSSAFPSLTGEGSSGACPSLTGEGRNSAFPSLGREG